MKNKRKLVESFELPNNNILLKTENQKLIENINTEINSDESLNIPTGIIYNCLAIIKDIPVTRYTKNLNGRIYTKELWEIVKSKGIAERTWCHANHSNDDGDVSKYLGVWHNFRVLEDKCVADLYVLDNELGKTLVLGLQAGGKVHFSTFGYGDFLYDDFGNETEYVDPNCYDLVRLGDWVSISSQNVITNIDDNMVEMKNNVKKENLEMDNKMQLTESNYSDPIKNLLKDRILKQVVSDTTDEIKYIFNIPFKRINDIYDFATKNEDFFDFLSDVGSGDLVSDKFGNSWVGIDLFPYIKDLGIEYKKGNIIFESIQKNEILEKESTNTNKDKIMTENKEMTIKLEVTPSYIRNKVNTAIREASNFVKAKKFDEALSAIVEAKSHVPEAEPFKEFASKLENMTSEIEDSKSKALSEATESVLTLQEKYDASIKTIEESKAEIERLKKIVEQAVDEVGGMGEMNSTMDEASDAIENLTDIIDQKDEEITQLETQVDMLQTEVENAQVEVMDAVAAAEEVVDEMAGQLEDAKTELQLVQEAYSKLKSKLKEEGDIVTGSDVVKSIEDEQSVEPVIAEAAEGEKEDEEEMDSEEEKDKEKEDEAMAESVELYVNTVIAKNPALKENRDNLLRSSSVDTVKRKIKLIQSYQEEAPIITKKNVVSPGSSRVTSKLDDVR